MFPSGIDGPVITQYHEEHHIGADGGKWKTKLSDESKFGHAHWIQENLPGSWELKTDLLGFVSIPHSHSGQRLGQALYKIYDRIGIVKKVCTVHPLL